MLQPGATDGRYLIAAGIPTYGLGGYFMSPDIGNIHGLNEYIGVDSRCFRDVSSCTGW